MWETTELHCEKGPLPHGPSQHHSVFAARLVTNLSLFQFGFHHNLLNVFSCNSSCQYTNYFHFCAVDTCAHPLLLPCFLFYKCLSLQCFISCTILERFCFKQKSWAMLDPCCYFFFFFTWPFLQCKSYWLCNVFMFCILFAEIVYRVLA